jgi:hypothetical protein
MSMLATIVDTKALLEVVWASLLTGVGGTAAFSLALVGATRFYDGRRAGRTVEATVFGALALISLAACAGAVVLGIAVILSK